MGSIGTLVDTSELQRQAFNLAFDRHQLGWYWSREAYLPMLETSGGRKRIENYAQKKGRSVDAYAIHRAKSEIFQQSIRQAALHPRAGVMDVVKAAQHKGIRIAFVTTTSKRNVAFILNTLSAYLSVDDFDLVMDRSDVEHAKPDGEVYCLATRRLKVPVSRCVAIEDNPGGVRSAKAAGLRCVAFPGENTKHCAFEAADL
ncbi:MAG: HAD-IA family hydrolase, partial [Cyanobacteria bacterium J06614_10]